MDSLGNVLDIRYYTLNDGCRNIGSDLTVSDQGGLIVWGHDDDFFILKASPDLTPQWARRFNQAGSFRFIKELPSGDLLAGFDMPIAGASIARLDANGNFIWCKSYMRPTGKMHDAIVESDSSFIITGFTSTVNANLFMMELDGEGAVQWCRGYGSGDLEWYTPQRSRLERTNDDNRVVLATLAGSDFLRPFLMKANPNGDTLWVRSMGAGNYAYHSKDMIVALDGGFLVSGHIWGDLPEMNSVLPYIFRTDSLGHFPCLNRSSPVELYNLFPTDSSFTLASTDGATMHQAFVSDTTFAPLSVYDACEVANAFRPYPDYKPERMRVRPNPTPGRVTISFTDPLMAESYYSVYDGMGKLLFQRPLPKGRETEEVDLSRFGAGTYVIRFTDKEGSCYERV
ncbi:MAG TPA: T9SS type A sorting domain-containing protein, partial [Flavobacteriales bacterium]|nr:T9SS type A sorting domain-containing protein [Flavobacteriales bacterium]